MKETKTATKVNVGDKFILIKGVIFSQRFIAKANDIFEVKKIDGISKVKSYNNIK